MVLTEAQFAETELDFDPVRQCCLVEGLEKEDPSLLVFDQFSEFWVLNQLLLRILTFFDEIGHEHLDCLYLD